MSSDEASRRRYRRLSSAADEKQHDALLASLRYVTLNVARLPVKLIELVEVRKLKVLVCETYCRLKLFDNRYFQHTRTHDDH